MNPKFCSNVTMSSDMPTVGDVTAQMYEGVTGGSVDGVFAVDPAGIAGLLAVTGPIDVPEVEVSLSAENVEQYLLVDQYEQPEADREAVLEAVAEVTIDRLLTGSLPPPQTLARSMADPALHGNLIALPTGTNFTAVEVFTPLALPRRDQLVVDARTSAGSTIVSFEGELPRRSVLSASGARAWR